MPSADNLRELLSFLAPGLIILGLRQWFVAAPSPKFADRALSYAGVSVVYYGLASPAFAYLRSAHGLADWASDYATYFGLPVVIGFVYALATYHEWPSKIWAWLGMQPVHHVGSAWDWTFKRLPKAINVIVTLNDGTEVAGVLARGSFVSSIPSERDILLSHHCSIGADGNWSLLTPPRSILLCGRDIRAIELFHGDQSK